MKAKKIKYAFDYDKYIELNGDRQNIRVRSNDLSKPVMLFLHGGPGVCDRHRVMAQQSDLTEVATLVCWDQRGAGKSYSRKNRKAPITIDMIVDDAIALIDYLRAEFKQDKIYLVGHSWGSVLGVKICLKVPEKIAYYIGLGQFIEGTENERLSWQFCIDEANKLHLRRLAEKLKAYPPINGEYSSSKGMRCQRDCLTRLGGADYHHRKGMMRSLIIPLIKSPEYSLSEVVGFAKGAASLVDLLWKEVVSQNFLADAKKLDVPVLLTLGVHDYNTPTALANVWMENLDAPEKEIVWFDESAHSPIFEEPKKWRDTVKSSVFAVKTDEMSEEVAV